MPKNAVDFITGLAEKAGIDKNDPMLIALIGNSNLMSVEVDPKLIDGINQKLMTVDAAKNNSDVQNHFRATFLNGVDTRLAKALDELGYDDATKLILKNELDGEKSTPEKAVKLALKIQALEKEKGLANKGDKAQYQTEIDKLQGQLRDVAKTHADALKAKDTELANRDLDYNLDLELLNYKFALPETFSTKIKLGTVKNILNDDARKKGINIVNENGALTLKKADGSVYYDENHQAPSFKQFADGVFAQNKLLVTSEGGNGNNNAGNNGSTVISDKDKPINTQKFSNKVQSRIAEFEKGSED